MTINSRQKGVQFEIKIINELKEIGYKAVSSRAESKNMDDKGVDIIDNTEYYFQCKAVEQMKQSYHDILKGMPKEKVPIVLHKRNNKGTVAVMDWEVFKKLML